MWRVLFPIARRQIVVLGAVAGIESNLANFHKRLSAINPATLSKSRTRTGYGLERESAAARVNSVYLVTRSGPRLSGHCRRST